MGMEIGSRQTPGMEIGAVQLEIYSLTASIGLFIRSNNMDIGGIQASKMDIGAIQSTDIVSTPTAINSNFILFIHGFAAQTDNLDLIITGNESLTDNLNLFVNGKDSLTNNLNLIIAGEETNDGSLNLFIKGALGEDDDNFNLSLEQLFKNADYSPQIIGRFITSPSSVTIEVWDLMNNNSVVSLTSNGCYEIGNTDRWGWSTINLPPLTRIANQYVFKMTANTLEVFKGEFVVKTKRLGRDRKPRWKRRI